MWRLCCECLEYAIEKTPVTIHCFVLMSNHYHLLVTTPDSNIDKFMEHFNKKLSNSIKRFNGAENHKFANRYKWTIVESSHYLFNVYRYIYQNPLRANLCRQCIDYPYSSLNFSKALTRKLNVSVHINYSKNKNWMETRKGPEVDSFIRVGLKKNTFKIGPRASTFVKGTLRDIPVSHLNCKK